MHIIKIERYDNPEEGKSFDGSFNLKYFRSSRLRHSGLWLRRLNWSTGVMEL